MASINKVIIIGNLGCDPEVRYTRDGVAICSVSIATSRNWKSKDSAEREEETEWHRVVFYAKLAEIAGEYLKKGRPVYVEGRLKTRKWANKEGKEQYTTEIIADQMQMFGGKESSDDSRDRAAPRQEQPRQAPRTHGDRPGGPKNRPSTGFDDMDSEIPF